MKDHGEHIARTGLLDRIAVEISAMLLSLLFIYTAISKLYDWEGSRRALYNQVFPIWFADILLYFLPLMELILAVLLLIPSVRRFGFGWSALVMASFTAYIGLVMTGIFGRVPCSCVG